MKYNVLYRWFCGFDWDEPRPDDTTLVVFRKRLGPAKFEELFDRVVAKAGKLKCLKGEWALVDGTKVIAHAARHNTISLLREGRRHLLSALAKTQPTKAGELKTLPSLCSRTTSPTRTSSLAPRRPRPWRCSRKPPSRGTRGIAPASQPGPRRYLGSFAYRTTRDGHQKADDPFFGYKVIATSNEKGIVQAAAVIPGNESEMGQIQGQIEQLEDNGVRAKKLAADKGYDSNGNRDLVAEHHLKPYIPVKKTSRDKTGFPFQYDKVHDCLVCRESGPSAIPSKHGYVFSFSANDCRKCPLAAGCLRKTQRRRQVFFDPDTGKHKPRGFKRAMRMRKTIERVFGEAKVWHRITRARYRGLDRVKIQVLMTFMVMNVKKMAKVTV